jgi:alanyl-tRNA synthetase
MLGKEEPFIHSLVALVGDMMSDAYPELSSSRDYAALLVRTEEEKFSSTLKYGLERLNELVEDLGKKGLKKVPGKELFRLYDTYGFPLDLATEVAEERGYAVDSEDFYKEMEKQRERARASWKGIEKSVSPAYKKLSNELHPTFTGYINTQNVKGRILAILRDGDPTDIASEGDQVELILDQSPFYAESGGQVGDTGTIQADEGKARVRNTLRPITGLHLQQVIMDRGTIRVGDNILSNVDFQRRKNIARNHSATHILQAALREVLGEHVKQAGSLVAPDRLRFDFNHFQSLTSTQLPLIEEIINQKIQENVPVETSERSLDDALDSGATALFGEKYGDEVRVVEMSNFSMELCGGTHVNNTGEIGLFKLISESSISAGVRRIEALTGDPAMERFLESERMLSDLAINLRVSRHDISEAVKRVGQQLREANRMVEALQLKLARNQTGDATSEAKDINGIKVLVKRVSDLDRSGIRSLADQLRTQLQSGIVVLGMALEGKVSLIAMVSEDLTERIRADELISRIAQTVKGGGGGRPEMAEAGGNDPAKLDVALEQVFSEIEDLLRPIEEPDI